MDFGLNRRQETGNDQKSLFLRLARGLVPMSRAKPGVSKAANEDDVLIESIREAKNDWKNAVISFEYADDQDLVDYYTYKIKACQVRYEYYIKKAKEKGLRIHSLEKELQVFQPDEAER